MRKTLFLYAHPNSRGSRANRRIVECVRESGAVTFHPLYDTYPEFFIDVPREQRLLEEHDTIVIQHPLYWYSMPALLKLWLDQVLEYDFAHGPEGNSLRGKTLLVSVTAGGPAASFREGALHGFPLETFLLPYLQACRLCAMRWEAPEILYNALDASEALLAEHGARLRARIEALPKKPRDI